PGRQPPFLSQATCAGRNLLPLSFAASIPRNIGGHPDTATFQGGVGCALVATPNAIVVIGTSAGGVAALSDLLAGFEAHWDVSVFITIHTGRTSTMQDILTWHSTLPVWRAEHQKRFARGVYVAPPDRHLLIDENTISLSAGPKENYVRPAIDPM